MFGRDFSGLDKDIERLKREAPAVLRAENELDREIFNGINENALREGSTVRTKVLDSLNTNQRQRVLSNFNGRFYERKATHHQYKVVVDPVDGVIALVSEEISRHHLCIDHSP